MARLTKKYTMGWYGGCNCKDINVSDLGGKFGDETFGKFIFMATDAQGTSYVSRRNSSSIGKLSCGTFYIVANETNPLIEIDIPDFHILSSNGKTISECCDNVILYNIDIENIQVNQELDNNVILDVKLENAISWKYSVNGEEAVSVINGTRATFNAPDGRHTLTVFALDSVGNVVDEETTFFEVSIPEPTPTPEELAPCCSEFQYINTKSTSPEENKDNFDPNNLQTGKKYGYVELQKSQGPFSSIKPHLNITSLCHNGANASDPAPPMDIQSIQNFKGDGFFNQDNFIFKHGEIAFGRQYQGKIQVTLNNGDCYEGCVCAGQSEVNLVLNGDLENCDCNG